MEFLTELLANKILLAALVAWAIAQVAKAITHLVVYKELKLERLWGSGGMPSSHAATVCALTMSSLLSYGVGSPVFALAFILMTVVLHDARGVRLETGKQAKVITAITKLLEKTYEQGAIPDVELKELVGHTPLQVLAGSGLGVIIGIFIH